MAGEWFGWCEGADWQPAMNWFLLRSLDRESNLPKSLFCGKYSGG
jgi:hypothetical protein